MSRAMEFKAAKLGAYNRDFTPILRADALETVEIIVSREPPEGPVVEDPITIEEHKRAIREVWVDKRIVERGKEFREEYGPFMDFAINE